MALDPNYVSLLLVKKVIKVLKELSHNEELRAKAGLEAQMEEMQAKGEKEGLAKLGENKKAVEEFLAENKNPSEEEIRNKRRSSQYLSVDQTNSCDL